MQIAIFIFYLLLVSSAVCVIPFFKNSGVGRPTLIALFYIKVTAGIAYGLFYKIPKYYANSDTWRFYRLSLEETKWLLRDPVSFVKDLFEHGYTSTGNIFSGENTYWNDLKSNLFVKIMAVFNVLTSNSYYTNIILFNFLFLFGLVALFKVFSIAFPGKKLIVLGGLFLLPSTLFWCSGIHKDGLILSATGLTIYCFYQFIEAGYISIKHVLITLLSFVLIFSLRNYVLLALIPAIISWSAAKKYPDKKTLIFTGLYLIAIISFFIIPNIIPSINPPQYVVEKQKEFLLLQGGSAVNVDTLDPTVTGFISFLPQAAAMAFLRPHVNEVHNLSYIPAVAENILLSILIILSLFSIRKHRVSPFVLSLLTFSITVLLICGYTIPFTGAIVRYKSLALPLLITPLLCIANFPFSEKRSQP